MDEEFIIFEREVIRNDPVNDIFIRLVCDKENEIRRYNPIKLTVQELMNSGGIVAHLLINDAGGDLFNHMKINTGATFTITYGHSVENSVSVETKILSYDQVNQTLGRPHDMQLRITFGSPNWYGMTAEGHGRGWSGLSYSDIVTDMVSTLGYTETDIGGTEGTFQSVVQPNWTNVEFLKWIAQRAKSDDTGSDGIFMFGVDTEKKFTFKSYDQLVNDNRSSLNGGRSPVIRMDIPPASNAQTEREIQDNDLVSPTFTGINVVEDYAMGCKKGASGGTAGHYDWESGEFITNTVSINSMNVPQLCDYTSLRTEMNGNTLYHDYGRDPESENYLKNRVGNENLNISKVNVVSAGMPKIHIFDFVELVIRNTSLGSQVAFNEMYSGFYMVSGIKHTFVFNEIIQYNTETVLMRHGVDDGAYQGFDDLVETATGKVV